MPILNGTAPCPPSGRLGWPPILILLAFAAQLGAAPVITGFRPPWGRPGDVVTVEGTELTHVQRVRLGNRPIREFKVASAGTSLVFALPQDWDPKASLAYPIVLKTGPKDGGLETTSTFQFYLLRRTPPAGAEERLEPPVVHKASCTVVAGVRYLATLTGHNLNQVIGLTVNGTAITTVRQDGGSLFFAYTRKPMSPALSDCAITVAYRGGTREDPERKEFTARGLDQLAAVSSAHAAEPQVAQESLGETALEPTTVAIPRPGMADLQVWLEAAHITQATQRMDGSIPLVQGKAGTLRVFVRAKEANETVLPVRVTVFSAAQEVLLRKVIEAPFPAVGKGIPTVEAAGLVSWNLPLEGEWIQPGHAFLAELLDGGETVASYPAAGIPQAMQVVHVPPVRITVIPIRFRGQTAELPEAGAPAPLEDFQAMFPVGEVEVRRGEPFEPVVAEDDPDPTHTLVDALEMKRLLDDPLNQRYYVGIFKNARVGPAGVAVSQAPVGILKRSLVLRQDSTQGAGLAHEMGHLLGLRHAPSGHAAEPDPRYPKEDGSLDEWGFNGATGRPVAPRTSFDIMGYHASRWISAFSYGKALTRLLRNAEFAPRGEHLETKEPQTTPCLVVTGTLREGEVSFQPAFELPGRPGTHPKGAYQLACLDRHHKTLATVPFEVEPGETAGTGRFEVLLPMTAALHRSLRALTVLRNGHPLVSLSAWHSIHRLIGFRKHDPGHPPKAHRVSGERVRVDWEAATYPGVLVRDAATGAYLATLSEGAREFSCGDVKELELRLSDGFRTSTFKVAVR